MGLELRDAEKRRYLGVHQWREEHPGQEFTLDAEKELKTSRGGPGTDPGAELFAALRECILLDFRLPFCGRFQTARERYWIQGDPRTMVAKWFTCPLPMPRIPLRAPFGALTEKDFQELLGYTGEVSDAELDRLTVECGIDLAEVS